MSVFHHPTSMSRLIRSAWRTLGSSSSSSTSDAFLANGFKGYNHFSSHFQCRNSISSLLHQSRPYATHTNTKSPFEANILRILHNEIEYQVEYAPPHQHATKFNSFVVQDRPGGQWMTMKGTYNDSEEIKLEVTMFDGYESVPKLGDDSSGEDVRLHISVLVDISKRSGDDALEFVCSAWRDCLEIHKLYLFSPNSMASRPYLGPHFRNLSSQLQQRLREILEARGAV
ncbi:hypothetical protein MANES_03G010800v8 [Manihot esculenta]|uniref:Uncharacterized protein n=1 Tax=Manihot esculenta TaxID=3983 RepID=A0ACB7HVJ6_MANES|nr:hypothetical protein MANES_03G010800v8 [Manihot esculenta]